MLLADFSPSSFSAPRVPNAVSCFAKSWVDCQSASSAVASKRDLSIYEIIFERMARSPPVGRLLRMVALLYASDSFATGLDALILYTPEALATTNQPALESKVATALAGVNAILAASGAASLTVRPTGIRQAFAGQLALLHRHGHIKDGWDGFTTPPTASAFDGVKASQHSETGGVTGVDVGTGSVAALRVWNVDLATDLAAAQASGAVGQLRRQYSADVVVLVGAHGEGCSAQRQGATAGTAFAAVALSCLSAPTLARAMGHLLGCTHAQHVTLSAGEGGGRTVMGHTVSACALDHFGVSTCSTADNANQFSPSCVATLKVRWAAAEGFGKNLTAVVLAVDAPTWCVVNENGQVCDGSGTCEATLAAATNTTSYTCRCWAGRSGADCSVEACDIDCSPPQGKCDGRGRCVCAKGWGGAACSEPVAHHCPSRCSEGFGAGGTCEADGRCKCDSGVYHKATPLRPAFYEIVAQYGVASSQNPRTAEGSFYPYRADVGGWGTVSFSTAFNVVPVVILGPPSSVDATPAVARLANVSKSGFRYRLQESECSDDGGLHGVEEVPWIALRPGTWTLPGNALGSVPEELNLTIARDGAGGKATGDELTVHVGSVAVEKGAHSATVASLPASLGVDATLLTFLQTTDEASAHVLRSRVKSASGANAAFGVQRDGLATSSQGVSKATSIGYAAISQGASSSAGSRFAASLVATDGASSKNGTRSFTPSHAQFAFGALPAVFVGSSALADTNAPYLRTKDRGARADGNYPLGSSYVEVATGSGACKKIGVAGAEAYRYFAVAGSGTVYAEDSADRASRLLNTTTKAELGGDCQAWDGPSACSTHGEYSRESGECACHAGFDGFDCSRRLCPASCGSGGTCNAATGVCACFAGRSGAACEFYSCPQDCRGRGECEVLSGLCTCQAPWSGPDCSVGECRLPCLNGGACDPATASCDCRSRVLSGVQCQINSTAA